MFLCVSRQDELKRARARTHALGHARALPLKGGGALEEERGTCESKGGKGGGGQ